MSFSFTKPTSESFNIEGIKIISQFMSKDVDEDQADSNININGNYAATPGYFKITAKPGFFYAIYRMLITVRDAGSFDSGSYGNGITLTNGIHMVSGEDNVIDFIVTEGVPVKVTPDWGIYCYDTKLSNFGAGNEQLTARWTFHRFGRPVILDGDLSQFGAIQVNDDLSGLVGHYFHMQGLKIPKK